MEIMIRENREQYLSDLMAWLREMQDNDLEEMGGFFEKRIEGYEAHMAVWQNAYCRFAELLPPGCNPILDLGCGTGLELDEIWKKYPDVAVTGVDLCQSMLDKLQEKHGDKALETVCMDYFRYDMGTEKWDAIISFESLHHFLPEQKKILYHQIYEALKYHGTLILGDYIACCEEEEALLRNVYLEKRKKCKIPEDVFVHFDIPLTLEHEMILLQEAGFKSISVSDSIEGATLLTARK